MGALNRSGPGTGPIHVGRGPAWARMLAAVLAIGPVAGACVTVTASHNTPGPAAVVTRALARTGRARSFRLSWTSWLGPVPVSQYASFSGLVDLAGRRLQGTWVTVTGVAAANLEPGRAPTTPSPTDTTMMICIGVDLWSAAGDAPTVWTYERIPAAKVLGGLPVADPGRVLFDLEARLADVTSDGGQAVDGVESDLYQGVEPLREPAADRTVPVNAGVRLWIDRSGLVRRLQVEATWSVPPIDTGTGPEPGGATTETFVAGFSDFGARTDIGPPPTDEVIR